MQAQGFNYQTIVRDASGHVQSNTEVFLRFEIYEGSVGGTLLYAETQAPVTDAFGFISHRWKRHSCIWQHCQHIMAGAAQKF